MQRTHITLSAALLSALLFTACNRGGQTKEKGTAHYKTMVVEARQQTLRQEYSARLQGRQIVEVRPQVQGTITRICIGEGEQVRRGQTLFVIDQAPYEAALQVAQASVQSAEARLATAELNLKNDRLLQQGSVVGDYAVEISANALKEARAALQLARAQERSARNNLSYTVVKSPVSGSASMIPWHVGSLVSSSIAEPLVTVADDSEVFAYFSVTERQAIDLISQHGSLEAFVRQSPAVGLRLATGADYAGQGRIDAVSGTVDQQTGAVTLRAVFSNPQRLLHNGGTATVVVPHTLDRCIVIPKEATYELQNRIFAYKVVNGQTKAQPIEVFRLNDGREYVVESGLVAGDTIVAEGAGLLKEGVKIGE